MNTLIDRLREDLPEFAEEDGSCEAKMREAADVIERYEAALHVCALEFDTGPATVMGAIPLVNAEFERRMHVAFYALHPNLK